MTGSALGRRFDFGLLARIAVLLTAGSALAWSIARPGLNATTLLAGLATLAALAELWAFLHRTNIIVARFVESVSHGDFSPGFDAGRHGGGFDVLGASLTAAATRLRDERSTTQEHNRALLALIDDLPAPLLSIDSDDRVTLLNKAARRLLGGAPIVWLADLTAHGGAFAADVAALGAGERRSTQLVIGGAPTAAQLIAAASTLPDCSPNWRDCSPATGRHCR